MSALRIVHHGAVDGVTGSCHELYIDEEHSVLIDCGLFQGAETSHDGTSEARLDINFSLRTIRALLVTHCHIDHVGRIPYLFAAGFAGNIYCSEPTAVLLPLVLEDAVQIGFTRDRQLVQQFLQLLRERLVPVPYKQWFEIPLAQALVSPPHRLETPRLVVKFQPAGHILGSAYIECKLQSGGQHTRVLFSGDLGATYAPLLAAPKSPYGTEVLVIESTYGDRQHENRRQRRQHLRQVLEKCLHNSGVVLIPAFSIGRTQELLYDLEQIIHEAAIDTPEGQIAPGLHWENMDIIVDSPLASRFTTTYRQLKDFWDTEAHRKLIAGRHPLSFEQLTTIDSHQAHLETIAYLQKHHRPAIVIAASGMCNGGRIVHYLQAFIGDPAADVVFVGYQAHGTPGWAIQRYGPQGGYVELDGIRYPIRAGIHALQGYSAHADQAMLMNFVKRMRKKPGEIRIVHGSEKAKLALQAKLTAMCPQARVVIP